MHVIPSRIHTYIGLVVGVVLVAAPWIFGFSDASAPTWTAVVIGLFLLANELTTTSPSSPAKVVPMRIHIIIEITTGFVLAISPWAFGFADLDANAWVPHLVVGILVAGYAFLTDPSDDPTAAKRTSTGRRPGSAA
ncbi:hypothetical protein EHW97_13985 [Aeromicrobium camelliae]|uniref:SPW repeat-containing integral membrane domain-containing protein n=1 Tax=Aeromicrobium camelliae TaxID=1538144 RepID=A0A3N6WKC7_9ACTN|nr:SPW repeat protein [Aeromicrobium camelliae]RQN02245.1 hypothetical protein EHW97_13985 [Aeromicrobium camelliae]